MLILLKLFAIIVANYKCIGYSYITSQSINQLINHSINQSINQIRQKIFI